MTIPSGGMQEYRGATKTLEANGGSITSGAVVQANDATYDTVTDGEGCPDAEFVLSGTFNTSPAEGAAVGLYARPLDVDGTGDTEVPEAARPTWLVGIFTVNNVTSLQYMLLRARDLPKHSEYYVHNSGTGQTLASGWTLKVTPITVAPAA